MSSVNVLSLFKREKKKICVIMDEIDGMNNGDKGGINTLIKLIRPKKTKNKNLKSIRFVLLYVSGVTISIKKYVN